MEQILTSTLHTCRHCLKELPAEAFYMDKRTRRPESCCKACRSAAYRKRYIDSRFVNAPPLARHPHNHRCTGPKAAYDPHPACPPSGERERNPQAKKAHRNQPQPGIIN